MPQFLDHFRESVNIFVFDEQIIIVLTTACANTDYEGNYA